MAFSKKVISPIKVYLFDSIVSYSIILEFIGITGHSSSGTIDKNEHKAPDKLYMADVCQGRVEGFIGRGKEYTVEMVIKERLERAWMPRRIKGNSITQ